MGPNTYRTGAPRRSSQLAQQKPKVTDVLNLGRKHKPDYWLVIWCLTLLVIGLVVVYAISPALSATYKVSSNYYFYKQLIAVALSLVVFVVTSKVPLQWWRQAYKPLLVVAGLATLMALALPVNPSYPAHRWVRLGSFSFQSVEIVKFAGLIWLAGFLSKKIAEGQIRSNLKTLRPLLFVLFGVGIIIAGIQSDLGSTGVIVAMMGAMAFIAGLPMKRIVIIALVVVAGLFIAISSTPYRRARLETFLHPQANCQGSGYQACQALIAVGSGGMIGLGLGSSVQAYGYLPEAANDSIFAIYAEKFGFIGDVILIGVFMAFFSRMKSVAERMPDDFTRLVVIGILTWLAVQTMINVGAMIGLLPLKGITLPFISYGGTSVVFSAAAVGLVFQASQYTNHSAIKEQVSDNNYQARRNYKSNTLRRENV